MFLSPSKALKKFGVFRFGRTRITKRNAAYIWMWIFCVSMLKLCWYMMLLTLWLMYAMLYGIYWCIKLPFRMAKKHKSNNKA